MTSWYELERQPLTLLTCRKSLTKNVSQVEHEEEERNGKTHIMTKMIFRLKVSCVILTPFPLKKEHNKTLAWLPIFVDCHSNENWIEKVLFSSNKCVKIHWYNFNGA